MRIKMNKISLVIGLFVLIEATVYAQFADDFPVGTGQKFLKRVENNLLNEPTKYNGIEQKMYNFNSKSDFEMLLFGDSNADVEILIVPSFESPDVPEGLRIVTDTVSGKYLLEMKFVNNLREVLSKVLQMYPLIPSKSEDSKDDIQKQVEHNRIALAKQKEESLKLYEATSFTYVVSEEWRNQLYNKVFSTIKDFVMKGNPASILDGYELVLRCVVGDEVWSLSVHVPRGELQSFAEGCKRLFKDARSKQFDEEKYKDFLK